MPSSYTSDPVDKGGISLDTSGFVLALRVIYVVTGGGSSGRSLTGRSEGIQGRGGSDQSYAAGSGAALREQSW